MIRICKYIRKTSTAKNCHPISLLSVLTKIFEKLVNNRNVDHREKCDLFSDQVISINGNLLTVVSDRIGGAT